MREIFFRAFVKDKGKIYNVKKIDFDYRLVWFEEENKATDTMRMFDQIELMQFTGLTDKNGKKIFEGDIVRYKMAYRFSNEDAMFDAEEIKVRILAVKYKHGRFYPLPYCEICDDFWYSHGAFDFEVIGNIHDNPEFLEVGG